MKHAEEARPRHWSPEAPFWRQFLVKNKCSEGSRFSTPCEHLFSAQKRANWDPKWEKCCPDHENIAFKRSSPRTVHALQRSQMDSLDHHARTDIDKEFNDGATPLLVASQPSQTKQRASSKVPTEYNSRSIGSSIHYGCNSLLVASQHGHADVAQLLCGARLILTRSLTMVQHLCLWHLSTDMQMSHNSFAEQELILTRSLTMVILLLVAL